MGQAELVILQVHRGGDAQDVAGFMVGCSVVRLSQTGESHPAGGTRNHDVRKSYPGRLCGVSREGHGGIQGDRERMAREAEEESGQVAQRQGERRDLQHKAM